MQRFLIFNGENNYILFRFLPDSPVLTSTAAPVFEDFVPLPVYAEPNSERTNISMTSTVTSVLAAPPGADTTSSTRSAGQADRDEGMCDNHEEEVKK